MEARSGGSGMGFGFRYQLANKVGTKGTFITGNPFGEKNDLTGFKLSLMGDKGTATTTFSSAKKANQVVKALQKMGFKSESGFPVYKFGDRNDFNKYQASKKGK